MVVFHPGELSSRDRPRPRTFGFYGRLVTDRRKGDPGQSPQQHKAYRRVSRGRCFAETYYYHIQNDRFHTFNSSLAAATALRPKRQPINPEAMDGIHASVISPRGKRILESPLVGTLLTLGLQAIEYARSKFNLLQPGEDLTQEECLAQADALCESMRVLSSHEN